MDLYLRQLYYFLQRVRRIDAWSLGWKKKHNTHRLVERVLAECLELVQQWLSNNFIGQLKWHLHGLLFRLEY